MIVMEPGISLVMGVRVFIAMPFFSSAGPSMDEIDDGEYGYKTL
jgi:hypothetical protein